MPSAPELRTVASRSDVMGLLRRHADLRSCDVALRHSEGGSLDTPERFGGGRPGSNGRSQSPLGAASEPVTIFDRVVGWIVAAPRDVPLPRDTPGPEREVARRRKAVLRLRSRTPLSAQQAGREDVLFDIVQRLPFNQRAAVVLRFYAQMTENDIAEALDVPRGSIGPWINRALTTMRKELQ